MAYINAWIGISQAGIDEFKDKRDNPNYSGPMTDETYLYLSKMADADQVRGMFLTPTIGGKVYHLFSINLEGSAKIAAAIADLVANYPSNFAVLGAWQMDSRQVGTQWELDVDGNRTGNVTGTPTYPVHNQTWRFMPPVNVYDENGDLVSSTPATSNADLRDINVLQGQSGRRFS